MIHFTDFAGTNTKLSNNSGASTLFDFLSEPLNIHSLIIFSDLALPAISGIVSKLENKFANDPIFPLSNSTNRQTTGRMIKFILSHYGYTPQVGGLDGRARLREFCNAKYFKTSSVYSLTEKPNKKIVAQIV